MNRPTCDGGHPGRACGVWPTWRVRQKGDSAKRNWLYACGRHINQVAQDYAPDAGYELDVVRIRGDE